MSCGHVSDLSHHLSSEARLRNTNPMKEIWRLARQRPGTVSLANGVDRALSFIPGHLTILPVRIAGDPHPSLYPIRRLEFEVASVGSEDPVMSWKTGGALAASQRLISSVDKPCALPIGTALQYSTGAGLIEAQRVVADLVNFYHSPPNHVTTLTLGNSDAVTKCFRLLGDPGDSFLADEFTFSSLINAALPQGINWIPVKMDAGGLIPEDLQKLLTNWDKGNGRKPHVLYTVPCGQNPTGSTLTIDRRKRIYELSQEFDLIIVEDDPYYFLQYGSTQWDISDGCNPLIPSFLSMDIDGRVIRVDTFSKIIAPGMRLGWLASNPLFHHHLVSYTDSSTQHPHGFGQILIAEMFGPSGWKMSGFDRWVHGLRREYQRKCDFFLDLFSGEIKATGLVSVNTPELRDYEKDLPTRSNVKELMEELFTRCLGEGLVIMPGSVFALRARVQGDRVGDSIDDRINFFRMTFASTEDVMRRGVQLFKKALLDFFTDQLEGARVDSDRQTEYSGLHESQSEDPGVLQSL